MIDDGIEPDVVSYSAVIDACARASDSEKAKSIFSLMSSKGVKPSIVTFTSLSRPFARRGNYQEVENFMREMEAMGLTINEYFVNVLLGAYNNAQPKQTTRAEALMHKMKAKGVGINDYVITSLKKFLERCSHMTS